MQQFSRDSIIYNMETKQDDFEDMFEEVIPPTINIPHHKKEFRLALLDTKKSAAIGAVFLILPLLFLSGVILKHYLQMDFGLFTLVYEWIGRIDREYGDNSILNWIVRILLLFGPLFAVGINLLSILHVRYENLTKEIVIAIKLKPINCLIVITCTLIFSIFFLYLTLENLR